MADHSLTQALSGCLLGAAVGDAIGLPYEGLSCRRIAKLQPRFKTPDLCLSKGLCSDDTEHLAMVAQALIVSGGEVKIFRQALAWRLRWWLLLLPAGVGFATMRACGKLWLGFPARSSGVFSAGNGAAMRSSILGVAYRHDPERLTSFIHYNTVITHTDPQAEWGAMAIALAASIASQAETITPEIYQNRINQYCPDSLQKSTWQFVHQAIESVKQGETTIDFAKHLGLSKGISGFVNHTVPIVIHVWLRHNEDYFAGITEIIRLGGDTDTTASILGGLIGARVGKEGIPKAWLMNIWEYPRSLSWLEQLAERLAETLETNYPRAALKLNWGWLAIRNFLFLIIVLAHGFRRLLPPYN